MGNEVSTVGGAVATAATSVAAGATLGQVDALNNAAVECAKYTRNAASKTVVRHIGETLGSAVATGAVAAASGVTFGKVDTLNKTVVKLAKHTAESAVESGKVVVQTTNDLANGIPVVGHIKGGIHYATGDKNKGKEAMKRASRSTGVIIGGVLGVPGGPVGMVAGGIAGGAVMDGITTGVESAIERKYTPSGQIKAWTNVATSKDTQTIIGGVVGGVMSPIMDGVGGYDVGTLFKGGRVTHSHEHHDLGEFEHVEVPIESISGNSKTELSHSEAEQEGNEGTCAASAVGRPERGASWSVGDVSDHYDFEEFELVEVPIEFVSGSAKPELSHSEAEQEGNVGAADRGACLSVGDASEAEDRASEVDGRVSRSAGEGMEAEGGRSNADDGSSIPTGGASGVSGRADQSVGEAREIEDEGREAEGGANEAVSEAGGSSSGICGPGRPIGSSGSSISRFWKTALGEEEGSIIHLSKLEDMTLYRGVNNGKNPYRTGGHMAQLGEGIYFTDDLDQAIHCAASQIESSYRVRGEVYQFEFKAAEWRYYMKNWTLEQEGIVRNLNHIDEFQVIKTSHGSANQYRFSPHLAEVMEQRGALVKLRDVSSPPKCTSS